MRKKQAFRIFMSCCLIAQSAMTSSPAVQAKPAAKSTRHDKQLVAGWFKSKRHSQESEPTVESGKQDSGYSGQEIQGGIPAGDAGASMPDRADGDIDILQHATAGSAKPAGNKIATPEITGAAESHAGKPAAAADTGDVSTIKGNAAGAGDAPAATSVGSGHASADGALPPLMPDAALISLLRDISRALKDSPDVEKLEDVCQKAAVHTAAAALSKALDNPGLPSNRIIAAGDQPALTSSMTAESWDSGEIKLSANCRASANAIWAKKLDGLINLAVAGNCNCRPSPGGSKLGEFVFVASGKSTMEKGLDIQSQSQVNFWLGKLLSYSIESTCTTPLKTSASKIKMTARRSSSVLKPLITQRAREHLALVKERRLADGINNEELHSGNYEANLEEQFAAGSRSQVPDGIAMALPLPAAGVPPGAGNDSSPRSPSMPTNGLPGGKMRTPSQTACLIVPDKAVAGHFLTAAVVNRKHAGENMVELTFNGAVVPTGGDGNALYLVPDDAMPGPTIQVSLPGKAEQPASLVNVLQPLVVRSGPQIPRVERISQVAEPQELIIIDGHGFDGIAGRNRVIIDGAYDARVLVSSPVQLKVYIPGNLPAGPHNVSVSTAGGSSNTGLFDLVSFAVKQIGRETGKEKLRKLSVRVLGTQQAVRVHIKNTTPSVLRVVKGNDIVLSSSGGKSNVIVLPVQRLRKGAYHLSTRLD